MENIQQVSDSYLCSNCGACSAICKLNAIDFKWSSVGRLYATVNDNCVECGLCRQVCPSLDLNNLHDSFNDRFVGDIQNVFVGRIKNERLFQNAQSGGVATGILAYLFETKKIDAAVVCKMEYGETPKVIPYIAKSVEELYASQKSCYTPVALLTVLNKTTSFNSVAIVGLPCHLQGIAALQHKSRRYENIKYKIGLICDRTECSGILDVIKDITNFDQFRIHWRQKYNDKTNTYDYRSASIVAVSNTGETAVLPRHYRIALKNMFTSPRCRICWDKLNVFSDITLGDPWRLKDIDAVHGESLVIERTQTGHDLLLDMKAAESIILREYDSDAPMRSQLIIDRRKQVAEYSAAMATIPSTIESYLCKQHEEMSVEMDLLSISSLKSFFELERLCKTEIISKAIREIAQFEKKKKHKGLVIVRLFKKILGDIKQYL